MAAPWSTSFQEGYWSHWRSSVSQAVQDTVTSPQTSNLIGFLATAQAFQVELLPIAWDPARRAVGSGATSDIRQSLVNVETSFAFKSFYSARHTEEVIFQTMINELTVLRQPAIRHHPNISQLHGICWDAIPHDGQHWPVLVFEKSPYEDLARFSQCEGRSLTKSERLSLCLDVGKALLAMHMSGIVHGDLKPQNILIFKEDSGDYQAKVIDFGYSARYVNEHEQRILYGTELWNAPEQDTPSKSWNLAQARRADLFTFGMFCFWLLFNPQLSERALSGHEPDQIETTWDKHKGRLREEALETLERTRVLEEGEAEIWKTFFASSLSLEPEKREESLMELMTQLAPESITAPELASTGLDHNVTSDDFELRYMILELYDTDYQVRSCITRCLTQLAYQSKRLARQAAFCQYIGFGVVANVAKAKGILALYDEDFRVLKEVAEAPVPFHIRTDLMAKLHAQRHIATPSFFDKFRGGRGQGQDGSSSLHDREVLLRGEMEEVAHMFGPRHIFTARVMGQLSDLYQLKGRWKDAETLKQRIVEANVELYGEEHPITTITKAEIADLYYNQGRWKDAEVLMTHVIKMLENASSDVPLDSWITRSMGNLASTYSKQGRWAEAETLLSEVAERLRGLFGVEHPNTLDCMHHQALAIWKRGRYAEAETLQRQVAETRRRVLGDEHPETLASMNNLVLIYCDQHRWSEARIRQTELVEVVRRVLGEEHPGTLTSIGNLARILQHQQEPKEAETLLVAVVEAQCRVIGDEHPDTLLSTSELTSIYMDQERWGEAEVLLASLLETKRRVLGEDHPDTLLSINLLAMVYSGQGRWEEAEVLQTQLLEVAQRVFGDEHPHTLLTMGNLASTYTMRGKFVEGIDMLEKCYQVQVKVVGTSHFDTLASARTLKEWREEYTLGEKGTRQLSD